MSINDHKAVRQIFKGFHIQRVSTKYCAMRGLDRGRDVARSELLIRNY